MSWLRLWTRSQIDSLSTPRLTNNSIFFLLFSQGTHPWNRHLISRDEGSHCRGRLAHYLDEDVRGWEGGRGRRGFDGNCKVWNDFSLSLIVVYGVGGCVRWHSGQRSSSALLFHHRSLWSNRRTIMTPSHLKSFLNKTKDEDTGPSPLADLCKTVMWCSIVIQSDRNVCLFFAFIFFFFFFDNLQLYDETKLLCLAKSGLHWFARSSPPFSNPSLNRLHWLNDSPWLNHQSFNDVTSKALLLL